MTRTQFKNLLLDAVYNCPKGADLGEELMKVVDEHTIPANQIYYKHAKVFDNGWDDEYEEKGNIPED